MANITETLTADFTPKAGVIIYEGPGQYGSPIYYLEYRDIIHGKMGAGKPLAQEAIQDIVGYFYQDNKKGAEIRGVVPEELLACEYGPTKKVLIWYNKPMVRPMYFTKGLHLPNGNAGQPGLIYIAEDNHLSMYAYKGDGRPDEDTKLYYVPYHNCSSTGKVCLGSGKVKRPTAITYSAVIKYYETYFWATEFSHLADVNSRITGNVNTYWKKAVTEGAAFDQTVLKPMGKDYTLGKLIAKHIK